MSGQKKQQIDIILVEKNGELTKHMLKDFDVDKLYKKCGFKNNNNFEMLCEWTISQPIIHSIQLFGKSKGKANFENKYDFPHPFNSLVFGTSILIGYDKSKQVQPLTLEIWDQAIHIINKGFDDLKKTQKEDEEEEDELAMVDSSKKTKQGYLKDGFVVDSDSDNNDEEYDILEQLHEGEIMEEEYQY